MTATGKSVAPVVLSASRRTDIPAFFTEWFFEGLGRGFYEVPNPYDPSRISIVSTEKVRFVVFWTKNAAPIISRLGELDSRGIGYYFQYTLNDYCREGWEPGLPPLEERIGTFRRLSGVAGPEKVIWRFDPLALSGDGGIEGLTDRVGALAEKLGPAAGKLVVSFVDIAGYRSVRRRFAAGREFREEDVIRTAEILSRIAERTGLRIATCCEPADLSGYGIGHNRCVDPDLMRLIAPGDRALKDWLDGAGGRKDKTQRKGCGCAVSRDIGTYGTCGYGCLYCYAGKFQKS